MRALPQLLEDNSDLKVIVAGADRRAYSYDAPSHNGSWREHLLEELGNFPGRERIKFTGLLNYNDYRLLLWRSNLHCYFTRPYVTSWSLFEAAACSARLAVSYSPATEGIAEGKCVTWVNLEEQEDVIKKLHNALNSQNDSHSKISPGFDLNTSLRKWEDLLNLHLKQKPNETNVRYFI